MTGKPSSSFDLAGAFDGLPESLGGVNVECPVCHKVSPPSWQPYSTNDAGEFANDLLADHRADALNRVSLDWMRCAHEECEQLIIRIHEQTFTVHGHIPIAHKDSWVARPRFAETERPLDPLVGQPFRTDYQEAAAILDASPRMSAVLSRSILADLLEKYLKLTDFNLAKRIDAFRADKHQPPRMQESMHHFREIADFGAHTQKNDQDQALPVTRDDAEWMLDFLDRLFDHFIVGPEKDRSVRERWNKNIGEASSVTAGGALAFCSNKANPTGSVGRC